PSAVPGILPSLFQFQLLPFPVGLVILHHLPNHHLTAPSVHQNVMIAPAKVIAPLSQPQQPQPQQRRPAEFESSFAFSPLIHPPAGLALHFLQPPPILFMPLLSHLFAAPFYWPL